MRFRRPSFRVIIVDIVKLQLKRMKHGMLHSDFFACFYKDVKLDLQYWATSNDL